MFDTVLNQPVIKTDRMVLRPPQRSDAGLLGLYGADQRVARMTRSIPHPLPPGTTEAFIARSSADKRSEDVWILDGSATGLPEVLGVIALERMERAQSEISYWVAPAFWQKGLASEAVEGLVQANPQQNRTMFASVFQDNPVSARVLTNTGFLYLGDAEAYCVSRGAPVPTWTYLKRY